MHDVGEALVRAGLAEPVLDVDRVKLMYTDTLGLMRDLKAAIRTRQAYRSIKPSVSVYVSWTRSTSNTGSASAGADQRLAYVMHVNKLIDVVVSVGLGPCARNSLSVSGPNVLKAKKPVGFNTRLTSVNATSNGSHHCSIRLLNTTSTLESANGNRIASEHTRSKRRKKCWRFCASRNMPGAMSSATTNAFR